MKKLVLLLLLAPLLPVSWAAFAADEAHTIVQKGRTFHPGEITINRGESLTFTNDDEFIHQIYSKSDAFNFDFCPSLKSENSANSRSASDRCDGKC